MDRLADDFRDWSSCDRIYCNMNLLEKLTEDKK